MAWASNVAREMALVAMKEDINYQLIILSGRIQLNTTQSAGVVEEKNRIKNQKLKELTSSGEEITYAQIEEINLSVSSYDTEITLLALAEEEMESMKNTLETKLAQIEAEEEQLEKQEEKNCKKEFGVFASNN